MSIKLAVRRLRQGGGDSWRSPGRVFVVDEQAPLGTGMFVEPNDMNDLPGRHVDWAMEVVAQPGKLINETTPAKRWKSLI